MTRLDTFCVLAVVQVMCPTTILAIVSAQYTAISPSSLSQKYNFSGDVPHHQFGHCFCTLHLASPHSRRPNKYRGVKSRSKVAILWQSKVTKVYGWGILSYCATRPCGTGLHISMGIEACLPCG